MPTVVPNLYSLDYTGLSHLNLVRNEQISLQAGPYRVFSPLYSPFFKKNIAIKDNATGLTLQESQYSCKLLVSSASAIAGLGNEVFSLVVITDEAVGNTLSVDYQTVGGAYTTGYEAIMGLVNNLLTSNQIDNNDSVNWGILEHLPTGFHENLHLHSLGDTVGWEFLCAELEKLRMAILAGDQLSKSFVLSYIDSALAATVHMQSQIAVAGTPFGDHVASTTNPHGVTASQIGLGLVKNYGVASYLEAYAGTSSELYLTADQVKAVVQDRVDLGLHSHVLDQENPHNTNKVQLGLDLIENYGVASGSDLATPVSGTNKYVTNHSAFAFLEQYFSDLVSGNDAILQATNTNATTALTAAQAALTTASNALVGVQSANATITIASQAADQAVQSSNQNLVNVQNSESAAQALVHTYVATAVIEAEAQGYSRGFTDGVASAS